MSQLLYAPYSSLVRHFCLKCPHLMHFTSFVSGDAPNVCVVDYTLYPFGDLLMCVSLPSYASLLSQMIIIKAFNLLKFVNYRPIPTKHVIQSHRNELHHICNALQHDLGGATFASNAPYWPQRHRNSQ